MASGFERPATEGDPVPESGDRIESAYDLLRRIAARYLHGEGSHTLQPTALVNEAYLKIAGGDWTSDTHFRAVASSAMRQILVDHARAGAALKRGGGWLKVTLSGEAAAARDQDVDLLALEEALAALAALDERKARVVELRFFGGLSNAESASYLGISPKTAEADWYFARAWLRDRLSEGG